MFLNCEKVYNKVKCWAQSKAISTAASMNGLSKIRARIRGNSVFKMDGRVLGSVVNIVH